MLKDHRQCGGTEFGDYNRKWPGSWPTLRG
uniref:Uncharacterized protein n=1 Tax=Romanomermis culicivorax TaxID=13658 RepID=A0A915HSH3_ROMCU